MYAPSPEIGKSIRPRVNQSLVTYIHYLNDDSLLSIFYLCRPSVSGIDEFGNTRWGNWVRERWWYKFVHICRRWRYLILDSASYLRLCLVCTYGTPVADMLANSPPFPLIIDYDPLIGSNQDITAEDEERITLALQHRDRVCRINLRFPAPSLQKLIKALDDEFPILEYLYITPPAKHNTLLMLPAAFEAPQLRLLILNHFASLIGSPLLMTATSLVTLALRWIHPSTYLCPDHLLQQISLLPGLEELEIGFGSPVPNREIEKQLSHMPVITHLTLPHLRLFSFWGTSAYLEALLPHVTTPFLKILHIQLFNQLSLSVPHLLQFMAKTGSAKFSHIEFLFYHEAVAVFAVAQAGTGTGIQDFFMQVLCRHLDWQVSSIAQIFGVLSPSFSTVEELYLDYRNHTLSSEEHVQADDTRWRELLGSFRGLKTLRIYGSLVGELSRSLQFDGELPQGLLPELKELICPAGSIDNKTFSSFIHEREVVGHRVNLMSEVVPTNTGSYYFYSSTGGFYVNPDPVSPP